MIVLDASALELLLDTPAGRAVATRIADPALALHVPHPLVLDTRLLTSIVGSRGLPRCRAA